MRDLARALDTAYEGGSVRLATADEEMTVAEDVRKVDDRGADDRGEVLACVERFFAAFSTDPGLDERLDALAASFLPQATIAHFTATGELVVDDVAAFIEPRRAYLAGAAVAEFREWPLPGEVRVHGNLAVWSGRYAKEGRGPGGALAGSGAKVIQLVRVDGAWRIAAVAWEDGQPSPS